MAKRTALRPDVQVRIAKYKENNPGKSTQEIAEKHGVSVMQVRYAIERFKQGKIGKKGKKVLVQETLERNLQKKTTSETLQAMVDSTIAEIEATDMTPKERAQLIRSLSASAKTLFDRDIALQIKNPDAERVAIMVRFLNPSLTDEQIIELWKKADETYRASKLG
jgi:transposase-like protein